MRTAVFTIHKFCGLNARRDLEYILDLSQQMKEMQNQPAVPSAETAVPAPASIPVAAATPSVPVVQPPYQQPVSQSSSSQPATTPAAENPQ